MRRLFLLSLPSADSVTKAKAPNFHSGACMELLAGLEPATC